MNQKSTTSTLFNANTAEEIINAAAAAIWRKQENEGEPLIPTLENLQAFTAAAETRGWIVTSNPSRYFVYTVEQHQELEIKLRNSAEISRRLTIRFLESDEGKRYLAMSPSEQEEWNKKTRQRFDREMSKLEWQKSYPDSDIKLATAQDFIEASYILPPEHFQPIAAYMLRNAGEPTTGALQWLHQAWIRAKKDNQELKHPLAPLVRAWLDEQTAKRIDKEYDRKHPTAVLKHPLGSIREITFVDADTARLREFATPESKEQVKELQLTFDFAKPPPSILPVVVPLEVVQPHGLPLTTKAGAVSHVLRIFDEALMALEPSQHQADIMFRLGDLINYLYPDGKFNRTNQLPYIINALETLHFHATVPFDQGTSELGYWRPVSVRTRVPHDAKNDYKIYLDVKLPPDARQGMMVEKAIIRQLGKESAPKYYAYRIACWIFDKYGTTPKGLIDPTRPIETRNDTGQLVGSTGKVILSPRGKPITDAYHPTAVKQLDRETNPNAIKRYPVLSNNDLILACYPNGYNPKTRARDLDRAKTHWRELEKRRIIDIIEEKDGWRIVPSEAHIKAYRGLKEAIKKSNQ